VEALSGDVARLRRQLTERQASWPATCTDGAGTGAVPVMATPSSSPSRSVTAGPPPAWNGSWTGRQW